MQAVTAAAGATAVQLEDGKYMNSLPIYQTTNKDLGLLQTGWAQQLNPVISNPVSKSLLLKDIVLAIGNNTINHLLGRKIQGWGVVDINGPAVIYRSAPLNDKTLTLNSDAIATITLMVF